MSRRVAGFVAAALLVGAGSAHAQTPPPVEPAAVAVPTAAADPVAVPTAAAAPVAAPAPEPLYGPAPPPQEMGPFPETAVDAAELEAKDAAGPPADPIFDRLFGSPVDPAAPIPTSPPKISAPKLPVWLWGILVLMVVALIFSRRSMLPKRGQDEGIDVRSRSTLGKDGHLVVVEVGDGQGGRRRLLVGYGTGAPRLVADLTPMPDLDGFADALELETAGTPVPLAGVPSSPADAGDPSAPPPAGLDGTSQRWEQALDDEDQAPQTGRAPRRKKSLQRRGDLIAEVLAERTRRAVEVGGDVDPDEGVDAGEGEAAPPPGTYTFRGTRG